MNQQTQADHALTAVIVVLIVIVFVLDLLILGSANALRNCHLGSVCHPSRGHHLVLDQEASSHLGALCDHFCDQTRREGKGKDGKG